MNGILPIFARHRHQPPRHRPRPPKERAPRKAGLSFPGDGYESRQMRSASGKKKAISRAAFSAESDPWMAFRSIDSA